MPAGNKKKKKSFGELFPQLFLFPLVIVLVCVLVYHFFFASGKDNRSLEQILLDMESAGSHARWQDAKTLADKVNDLFPGPRVMPDGTIATSGAGDDSNTQGEDVLEGEYFDADLTQRLLHLWQQFKDEKEFRTYLTFTLGRAGKPELTIPLLSGVAMDANNPPEERLAAILALGLSRSKAATEVLERVLKQSDSPEDWDFRLTALGGLANARAPSARGLLRAALEDSRQEVRWHAAFWLANFFKDDAGMETLKLLVEWDYLDEQRDRDDRELQFVHKEKYMIWGLRGLAAVAGQDARLVVEERSKDSRSLKVRNAALLILKEWKDAAGAAAPEETQGAAPGRSSADDSRSRASKVGKRRGFDGGGLVTRAFLVTVPDLPAVKGWACWRDGRPRRLVDAKVS